MLVLAAAALVLGALEPAPLRIDLEAIAAAHPLPAAQVGRRSISAPWVLAPALCQAFDGGSALWAEKHRPSFEESNMTRAIKSPGRMLAIKATSALITAGGTWLLGRVNPTAGKVLATGSCGWTMFAAGSNFGLWGYRGPRTGL